MATVKTSRTKVRTADSDQLTRTITDTATRLGVSHKTVRRMIDEGRLKTVRPLGAGRGRLVLVTEDSIRALLATAA
ncbi:helix-turn-helix domain-containing protein [Leucobacter massiliensis]|uniref:helix-turn-helix domain-containing protein n=1 Tax=Leucobacter massiliensis TaxID=1686285 RepID=UPI0015E3895D|nr:helix-turn-helix domain-containing protein [Leucobacter massiliensis]